MLGSVIINSFGLECNSNSEKARTLFAFVRLLLFGLPLFKFHAFVAVFWELDHQLPLYVSPV